MFLWIGINKKQRNIRLKDRFLRKCNTLRIDSGLIEDNPTTYECKLICNF